MTKRPDWTWAVFDLNRILNAAWRPGCGFMIAFAMAKCRRRTRTRSPIKTRSGFVGGLAKHLTAADVHRIRTQGRATRRRLNRHEYEQTLRRLLDLPGLPLKQFLPEDTPAHGFNKVGDALDVSHVHMDKSLQAAEFALRAAMAPQAARPAVSKRRYYAWEDRNFTRLIALGGPVVRRMFPLEGGKIRQDLREFKNEPLRKKMRIPADDPDLRASRSIVTLCSSYEPSEIRFSDFRAPVTGRYRLTFRARSVWMSKDYTEVLPGRRPEPVTLYADTTPRILRRLAGFDVRPDIADYTVEAWLIGGETIMPDAVRLVRPRPPDTLNHLETDHGSPGVDIHWLEVEGPLFATWPPPGHRLLFDDLPLSDRPTEGGALVEDEGNDWAPRQNWRPPAGVDVASRDPEHDAERLLTRFSQSCLAAAGDFRRCAAPARAGDPGAG